MKNWLRKIPAIACDRILTDVYLRNWQDKLLFNRAVPESKIKLPQTYGPQFMDFKTDRVKVRDGTTLGLWVKEPEDGTKPVYVVFSGRHGHWAHAGLSTDDPLKNGDGMPTHDPQLRLSWLAAMADTGAGVIAVHSRGHGLSRHNDTRVGEAAAEEDVTALTNWLIAWLDKRNIPSSRVGITCQSMGGAQGAKLAREMDKRHRPVRMLSLIVSFANLVDVAAEAIEKKLPKWLFEGAGEKEIAERRNYRKAWIAKHLHHAFKTTECIASLNPEHTAIYIANAHKNGMPVDDGAIPADQYGKLCAAAEKRGLRIKKRPLTAEYLTSHTDPHSNWNPEKVAADIDAFFHELQQGSVISSEDGKVSMRHRQWSGHGHHHTNGKTKHTPPPPRF